MPVGSQLPVRALRLRVDAATELAERGVGVDGHHPIVLAQLGEHRTDACRHRGLADAALAQYTDLVVAAQHRLDTGRQLGLSQLVLRWTQVDESKRGAVEQLSPPATR
jgi:hypothetical protein